MKVFLDFNPKLRYFILMKTKEQLLKDLAWWQDKLNRSRKESLRSIRAIHVQHLQSEIAKLTQEIQAHDLEMLSDMPKNS